MGKVKYFLRKNSLTSDPNDYFAVVKQNATVGYDAIIEKMIDRGSTVTKAEAMGVIEEFFSAMSYLLELGNNVSLDYIKIRNSIKGKFVGEEDGYDPARHQLKLNVTPGKRLLESLSRLSPSKIDTTVVAPSPRSFLDVDSGTVNQVLTPDKQAKITGSQLKFDPLDATQGVFFVATNGTATKATAFATISPSTLVFLIPSTLVAGDYVVQVRAIPNGNKSLKEGRIPAPLTV